MLRLPPAHSYCCASLPDEHVAQYTFPMIAGLHSICVATQPRTRSLTPSLAQPPLYRLLVQIQQIMLKRLLALHLQVVNVLIRIRISCYSVRIDGWS